jgi:hypothetical protein
MLKKEKEYNECMNQAKHFIELINEIEVYNFDDFSNAEWKYIANDIRSINKVLESMLEEVK